MNQHKPRYELNERDVSAALKFHMHDVSAALFPITIRALVP